MEIIEIYPMAVPMKIDGKACMHWAQGDPRFMLHALHKPVVKSPRRDKKA